MSDVDISVETVERLARQHDLSRFTMGMRAPEHDMTAATLRALRAALDAAQADNAAWHKAGAAMLEARDAALAALGAAETDLAIARADLDNSGATSVEIAAERDAALAARDAAWRAALDAAADVAAERAHSYQCAPPTAAVLSAIEECDDLSAAIRALQPPADLAAEAPGDAVAKEREACAVIAESTGTNWFDERTFTAQKIAAAIRARAGA